MIRIFFATLIRCNDEDDDKQSKPVASSLASSQSDIQRTSIYCHLNPHQLESASETLPFAIMFSDLRAKETTLLMSFHRYHNGTRGSSASPPVTCSSTVTRKRAWRPSQSSRSPFSLYALV